MRGFQATLLAVSTLGCVAPLGREETVVRREPAGAERICHLAARVGKDHVTLFGVDGVGVRAILEQRVTILAHFETAAARTQVEASSGGLHLLGWIEAEALTTRLARDLSVVDHEVNLPAGTWVGVRAVGNGAYEVRPSSGRLARAVGAARCLDLDPPTAPLRPPRSSRAPRQHTSPSRARP
ncbi:MAG: hypothetical protein IPJ34_19925 [Myxococcales bacterium]|nr:hypothetical protein [Myxococcales bacterium]